LPFLYLWAMNFFLIDDDHEDQEIFKTALQELDPGHECILARDPVEALSILNNNKNLNADLIFLDLNMPRMNGPEGLIELRKDPRLQQTPIYFYSTHKAEMIANAAITEVAGFISKPESISGLTAILKKLVIKHNSTAS